MSRPPAAGSGRSDIYGDGTESALVLRLHVLRTNFVLDALEQAIYDRCGDVPAALVHHSDRGTQYVSLRYTERLADAGIAPSVGSRGDSYDNALAESVIGLYQRS